MQNNINTNAYVEGVGCALDESEIKSLKTTSVRTANAISKALSDSGIHHLYSACEIEILRQAEQLIDRRARALAKAAKMKAKDEKEWAAKRELEMKAKKDEIHNHLFADRSDDEAIIVITAFAEFLHVYPMRYIRAERFTKMAASSHIEVKELKNRIVDALYEHQEHWAYAERFSFDRFDAYCDQRLAEAAYVPHLNTSSDDAAEEFSL